MFHKKKHITEAKGRTRLRAGCAPAAIILACLLPALPGCGKNEPGIKNPEAFRHYSSQAVALYKRIHPIRSSALGFHECDSLLFTFSEKEISSAVSEIDTLLGSVAAVPAAGLEQGDLDLSRLIINWLRGEAFSFGELRLFHKNPLLYCWVAEEALCGIPSRLETPEVGEFEAYGKRLARVPALFKNAAANLQKPAEINVAMASGRITALTEKSADLTEAVMRRYGRIPESLAPALRSAEDFGTFLSNELAPNSQGSFILGSENLAQILGYSELLDPDPANFIVEAEKTISSYISQLGTIESNFPAPEERQHQGVQPDGTDRAADAGDAGGDEIFSVINGNVDIETTFARIEKRISEDDAYSSGRETAGTAVRRAFSPLGITLPVNPYMLIPPAERRGFAYLAVPAEGDGDCEVIAIVPPDAESIPRTELLRSLLEVSSPIRKIAGRDCANPLRLEKIFSGQSFHYGWAEHNMKDLSPLFPEKRMELRRSMLESNVFDLALMVIVFKLHSGTYTLDSAADFLAHTLSVDREEASRLVSVAAAFPSSAIPGISLVLLEDLVKEASYQRGERKPREKVRKVLDENAPLPLVLMGVKVSE